MAEKKSPKKNSKTIHANKELNLEKIKDSLKQDHACYVLITCSHPSDKGKMEVELNFEGDESLAAYLVDSAQSVFDQKAEPSIDSL
jgi:hypothetical protein